MKTWNLTMITGLAGVLYFILLTIVSSMGSTESVGGIAFAILSIFGLLAVWENFRERNISTWKTWVGLVGGLLIVLPGACFLLGNLILTANSFEPSTMVNTLLSVSAIGVIFLLPIGIALCLVSGFARFYAAKRLL